VDSTRSNGLATFLAELERALNLGARWRYHREMQASFENVVGTIDLYPATESSPAEEAEAKKPRAAIMEPLVTLQRLEANIPGVGSLNAPAQS
jgi:hypothetical protein